MPDEDSELETKEYVISNDNEIVEIDEEEYKEDLTSFEQDVKPNVDDEISDLVVERNQDEELKKKNEKKSFKEKWKSFSKKKKIIIISSIILLLIAVGVLLFVLLKEDKKQAPKKDEPIVIEKENYRYEDGKLILLDKNDKEIGEYTCKNKNENLCFVANRSLDDFDEDSYIYEDGSKVNFITPIINDKYVFISDNKKSDSIVSLYDIEEQKVLDKYKSVKYYTIGDKSYLILENLESMFALYEVKESELNQILDYNYDYLGIKNEEASTYGYLVAKKNDKYIIIDFEGKEISKKIGYEIKSFNKDYIVGIEDTGSYVLLDYNNNKIFNNVYSYLKLQDDLVIAVKGDKLFFVDYDENKLKDEEITLANDYYNKTYIYNENNKYLETKEAFWITDNEDNLSIEYYDSEGKTNSIVVNVYEGLVSKKYDYVSYYDGVLNFYSDKEKTNLLGKYKCTNKNNITSADSTYNVCYAAKESNFSDNELSNKDKPLGYVPIINNRYVFINDSLDPNIGNIILYDLVDKKNLGTYLSVDLGLYTGNSNLESINNEALLVIAKSARKNKFGVIKVENSKVSSVIGMEYNSIERIGEYFEVENASGTYELYSTSGSSISSPMSNKIVNYSTNYLKVLSDNGYKACSYNAKDCSKTYPLIDIQSSYFVTLDSSGSIAIYEGDNFTKPITDNENKVLPNEYVGVSKRNDYYDIKTTTNTISVSKYGNNEEIVNEEE